VEAITEEEFLAAAGAGKVSQGRTRWGGQGLLAHTGGGVQAAGGCAGYRGPSAGSAQQPAVGGSLLVQGAYPYSGSTRGEGCSHRLCALATQQSQSLQWQATSPSPQVTPGELLQGAYGTSQHTDTVQSQSA